jgi:hypothetical protein
MSEIGVGRSHAALQLLAPSGQPRRNTTEEAGFIGQPLSKISAASSRVTMEGLCAASVSSPAAEVNRTVNESP